MKLKITDLIVEFDVKGRLLASRIGPYIYNGDKEPDIVSTVSEKFYRDRQLEHEDVTLDECEYLYSGSFFYEQLALFNGLMLHSSCVEYKGKAYLFSASSGTGKSTHTHLWLKYLPDCRIINDDKPAIRIIDGVAYAYGTPWSGKTDENINEGVPIGGICFLGRGENKIKRIPGIMALKPFMDQTVRPADKELMNKMLETLNWILTNVPIYKMTCDISEQAVMTAVNGMVENSIDQGE
ncbi:MAG: hypothetical protein IIX14_07780 [Clostridia bacterium]|nr:hypothetical protein [Clostridia bacterium]